MRIDMKLTGVRKREFAFRSKSEKSEKTVAGVNVAYDAQFMVVNNRDRNGAQIAGMPLEGNLLLTFPSEGGLREGSIYTVTLEGT